MKYEIRGITVEVLKTGSCLLLDVVSVEPSDQKIIRVPLASPIIADSIVAAFTE